MIPTHSPFLIVRVTSFQRPELFVLSICQPLDERWLLVVTRHTCLPRLTRWMVYCLVTWVSRMATSFDGLDIRVMITKELIVERFSSLSRVCRFGVGQECPHK